MTTKRISELSSVSVLDGTEMVPVVQNGITKQSTVTQLVTTDSGGAPLDSSKFSNLSDWVASLNANPRVGLLAAGTYIVSSTLVLTDPRISIVGAGQGITIIKAATGFTGPLVQFTQPTFTVNIPSGGLRNLTLRGSGSLVATNVAGDAPSANGCLVQDICGLVFEDLTVEGFLGGYGIKIKDISYWCERTTFNRVFANYCGDGIVFEAPNDGSTHSFGYTRLTDYQLNLIDGQNAIRGIGQGWLYGTTLSARGNIVSGVRTGNAVILKADAPFNFSLENAVITVEEMNGVAKALLASADSGGTIFALGRTFVPNGASTGTMAVIDSNTPSGSKVRIGGPDQAARTAPSTATMVIDTTDTESTIVAMGTAITSMTMKTGSVPGQRMTLLYAWAGTTPAAVWPANVYWNGSAPTLTAVAFGSVSATFMWDGSYWRELTRSG